MTYKQKHLNEMIAAKYFIPGETFKLTKKITYLDFMPYVCPKCTMTFKTEFYLFHRYQIYINILPICKI